MNLPSNLGKSTLLASAVFWGILGSKVLQITFMPFVLLSFIPIFICVASSVIVSICPIFWLTERESFNKKRIFKAYFPYYAIVVFGICVLAIIDNSFSILAIAFFSSAFISTCQSWVWFAKEEQP
jgi:hypothetical protein